MLRDRKKRKKKYTPEDIEGMRDRLENSTFISSDIQTVDILMSYQMMGQDVLRGGGPGAYGRYYDPFLMKSKYDKTKLDFDTDTLKLAQIDTPERKLTDKITGKLTRTSSDDRTFQLKSFLIAVEEYESGRNVTLAGLDEDILKALKKDSKWSKKIKTMKESGRFKAGRKLETCAIPRVMDKRPDIVRDDILHLLHQDGTLVGSNYERPRDGVTTYTDYLTNPESSQKYFKEEHKFEYGAMLSSKLGIKGLLNPDMSSMHMRTTSEIQPLLKDIVPKLLTEDDWSNYTKEITSAFETLAKKNKSFDGVFKPEGLTRSKRTTSEIEEREVETIVTDMDVPEELRGMSRTPRTVRISPRRGGLSVPTTPTTTETTPTIETRPRSNDIEDNPRGNHIEGRPRSGRGTPPSPPGIDLE